jgi:hypothetical protein
MEISHEADVSGQNCDRNLDLRVYGLLSVGWSEQRGVSLSIESAQARIGRPLTPVSLAGVARRQNRRAAYGYGAGVVGAGVAAAAIGTAAAAATSPWDYYGNNYYGSNYYGATGWGEGPYAATSMGNYGRQR